MKPPEVLKPYEAADRLKRAYVQVLFLCGHMYPKKVSPCAFAAKALSYLHHSLSEWQLTGPRILNY